MLEDLKQFLQTFLMPQLEGIRGDIRVLDAKMSGLDAKMSGMDMKIESYRRESIAEIRRVEETLSADFVRLESKVDLRLASMDEKLETFRRELLAEIRAASK